MLMPKSMPIIFSITSSMSNTLPMNIWDISMTSGIM